MITEEEKKLLAWALDCALTEREKVGLLKMASVMAAAKKAIHEPQFQNSVIGLVELLSPEKANNIRQFLKDR